MHSAISQIPWIIRDFLSYNMQLLWFNIFPQHKDNLIYEPVTTLK